MAPSKNMLPLIKGYLPVRVLLPGSDGPEQDDETFFFVKEHRTANSSNEKQGQTLFVANAPVVPGVRTQIMLRSLLGRYGEVERVTVVENPRLESKKKSSLHWTSMASTPSCFGPIHSQGRFAHVLFTSPKEMKRAWRMLCDIMSGKSKHTKSERLPGLYVERLEIQTLSDETQRVARRDAGQESDDESDDEPTFSEPKKGILAVASRYRESCKSMSREALMEVCNETMEAYENEEEEDRRKREQAKSEADEDGFITVTYSAQSVGSKRELEKGIEGSNRRHGVKRSRKKKKKAGVNTGLTDFYRFQTKDSRKRGLQDLRKRFEEDLAKVEQMKEERQYKPF